jgi:hypothetical protein
MPLTAGGIPPGRWYRRALVSAGDYLAGAAYFLPTVAASLGAAAIVVRKRYEYLSGLPRALVFCVLGTAALIWVHLLPAIFGELARGAVLAAALLVLAAAWLLKPARAVVRDPVQRPPVGGGASIAIAVLAVGGLAAYEVARLRGLLGAPLTFIDLLGFHLPGVARWIQTGTVWQVDQFLPGFATAQYPNNGDLLLLATVLPWRDLAFARLPGVLFFVLTGVSVYALAIELGARKAAAATFAAFALAVPPVSIYALEGLPDDITLSLLAIGILFLLRHARTRRGGELAIGGLAIGLALGTKWFGLTAAAVIVVIWVAARVIARRRPAELAREGGLLLGTIALGGGFWLVRNLVESGNPLYPKAVSLFGVKLFAGSRGDVVDRFGFTIAHYLTQPRILREYIYPGFKSQLGVAGLVLLAGLVIALVYSVRKRRQSPGGAVLAVALVTVGICITYVITPGTAYGPKNDPVQGYVTLRWLMPAVVTGAAVCAAAVRAIGRCGIVLELAALAGVADAIHLGPPVAGGTAVLIAVLLAVGAGAVAIVVRACRTRRPRASGARAAVLIAAVLAALVFAARLQERQFDKRSYAPFDPTFAWIDAHAPTGHRVGITGATGETPGLAPVLPAFGPRLGNQVSYVGDRVVHSVDLPATLPSFQRDLRSGHDDLLMIGLPYAGETDVWARRLGFQQLARSNRVALYAVPPSER